MTVMAYQNYEKKFEGEKRKAFLATWLLDTFLIFYACFIAYFFVLMTQQEGEASTVGRSMDPKHLVVFGALSFIAAFAWGWWGRSPAVSLIYRTNKYLKGVVRDEAKREWWKKPYLIFSGLLLVATFLLGFTLTDFSFRSLFNIEGFRGAMRIFGEILSPEMSIIGMVLSAMLETIFIALIATSIAVPISFFLAFFCARNLVKDSVPFTFLYYILRTLCNFTRSVEPVIWAIIFAVWVSIGPFAGMLALMLHSFASLTKIYSELIEAVDHGPIEAMEATGAHKVLVVWHAVVPQVLMPYLSYTFYRWDINIRMATIIGLVGGGGVGTLLMQYQGLAQWHEVGTILIVITIVVWTMDILSGKVREALL